MDFAVSTEAIARILVVEDDPIIARLLEKRLTVQKYEVIATVSSGEEAVEKALAEVPDLILMDIGLHGQMDGVTAAERIRSVTDIPVVYLSGLSDSESLERAKITSPFGYIVKPFQDVTLKSTIEMALYKHRMESRLKRSEQWFATTLRSIGEAVIATDTSGSVTFLNPLAENLSGWSQEEALGKILSDILAIRDDGAKSITNYIVEAVINEGKPIALLDNTHFVTRGDNKVPIELNAAPIRDGNGNILGMVLVLLDISDKIKMETELFKAQKLESIGILAGGIAHDFNNLLTAILGNISLAKMYVSGEDKVFQKLNEAENASLRARDLTQQLLTFSRGGAPIKRATSIVDIVKDSVTFTLSGSKATCRFDIPDEPWTVEIDEGQISQVINNLIINAVHSMPDGGDVEIACRNVHVVTEDSLPVPAGRYVIISIKDHGIGIDDEILPKIFDPYFTTKKDGKGLGLTTVYSIVKNHGGQITADSKPGVGTTFTIYLPSSGSNVVAEPEGSSTDFAGRGKILVMDDEKNIRDVAGEMLDFIGYECEPARDGAEAIDLYGRAEKAGRPFSAVLMDLTIPGGMGGRDAVRVLREKYPHVKAIVSSGYSNDPIMADYRSYGFHGVITKPYKVTDLKKVLEDVLAGGGR